MGAEKANYPVARMARLLGVSRSGFYAWEQRKRQVVPGPAALRRGILDRQVVRIHTESHATYGAPRIRAVLAGMGVGVDVKTVAASLRRQGLEGISPRKFTPVAPLGKVRAHSIPDLVERRWDTGALDAIWISDITYLRTQQGWVYLCAVRDGCSRRVIGWAMDSVQDTALVIKALRMAMVLRQGNPGEVVFHADRGTQFTSAQMHAVCKELGVSQSVGRTGVCWDNAMQESFWSTLKTEFYNRRSWPTRHEAMTATGCWIEEFYNRQRIHSALDYLSPVAYENQVKLDQLQTAKAA